MKRRVFLSSAAPAAIAAAKDLATAPTDADRLNTFATHYNRYVEQLRNGIVDLKEWGRAISAWKDLA